MTECPIFTGADDERLPIAYSINTKDERHLHWEEATVTRAEVREWVDLTMGPLPSNKHAAGGFVFGKLQTATTKSCRCPGTTKRKRHKVRGAVAYRSAIVLDPDKPHLVDDFLGRVRAAGWSGLIYTSASATVEEPKYRLIFWVDRAMTEGEYWLVTQSVATRIGIAAFDKGSWEAERTMYRPASEHPEAFYAEVLEGKPVDVDEQLDVADMLDVKPRRSAKDAVGVEAGSWLRGLPGSAAEPCPALLKALDGYCQRFTAEDDKNPVALDAVNSLVHLAEEGHHGIVAAVAQLQEMFQGAITGGRDIGGPGGEFDRMLTGATAIVAASRTTEEQRACCLEAEDVFTTEEEVRDPFAVLTGHVTRGLGRKAVAPIAQWKTEKTSANDLAKIILAKRWTKYGESGDEDCKVLRMWNSRAYEWHTTHWEVVPPDHLDAELKRILDAAITPKRNRNGGYIKGPDGKKVWIPLNVNPSLLGNVARLVALDTIVHARLGSGHWIDCTSGRCAVGEADRRYISFANGILDLEKDVLSRHESAFFNTYSMGFDYDPLAVSPKWVATLESWFPGDQVSQSTLEEVLGYLLLGGMELDKIFVFLGKPRGGKGTVMRIVKAMLGTGFSSQALDEMGDRFGKEDLIGKRVIHITEAVGGPGARKVVSTMKAVSGRDDGSTIKTKGGKSVQVDLECRFVLTGNEDLELPDSSGVIADRIVAVKFGQSFLGREDHELEAKLRGEYSGIFNRLRSAYARLMKRGKFVQPTSGQVLIDRIRRSAAPGKTWFEESIEVTKKHGDWELLDDVAQHFRDNCEESAGKGDLACKRIVTAMLTDAGLSVAQEWIAGKDERGQPRSYRHRVVRGVRIKELDDPM